MEERARVIRAARQIPGDALVVGFVGWLVADKGINELIEAFTTLAEKRKNLYLLMIGADGGARDPLPERTLTAIREHPQIVHAGLVDDPTPYYAAMDVCTLPTLREGYPYAVLEAAAMGVPMVATRVTGCVDGVVDGETGLLIEPRSAPPLRDAIEALLGDDERRRRMGEAAARRVVMSFGSERLVGEHLKLYRSLLPSHVWTTSGANVEPSSKPIEPRTSTTPE